MIFSGTFKKITNIKAKNLEAAPPPVMDFTLLGIGRNNKTQLGITPTETNIAFVEVTPSFKWIDISTGRNHGILLNVSGEVWGLGETAFNQLGTQINTSATPIPLRVGVESDFKFITANYEINFGIKSDGTIWGIGNPAGSMLGVGASGGNWTQLSGDTDWVSCANGQFHVVALKSNGTMWGRGVNTYNQLDYTPTNTSGISIWRQMGSSFNWKAIESGTNNTYGVTVSGDVYAVGQNHLNQSGANPTSNKTTFTLTSNSSNTNKIAAKDNTAWILKNDGTIWALGSNNGGASGGSGNKAVFTQVGNDNDWVNIRPGLLCLYAQKIDGTWWGLGFNLYGEQGVSAPTSFSSFVQVTFNDEIKFIDGGYAWAWALK